jgi:hypothetical protein
MQKESWNIHLTEILIFVRHGTLCILSWWAEPIHIWIWMPNKKNFTTNSTMCFTTIPIQRMGAAPGVIHTGRFFVLIPLEVVGKINGGER